jgi:hypothetical protein
MTRGAQRGREGAGGQEGHRLQMLSRRHSGIVTAGSRWWCRRCQQGVRGGAVIIVVVVVVVVVASSCQAQGARGGAANLSMPASQSCSGVIVIVVLGGFRQRAGGWE